MLISRCAWHVRNFGHAKLLGVAGWRGLRIEFADGICRTCAARVRSQSRHPQAHPSPVWREERTSDIVVVALAIMTALVLVARPANEGSVPVEAIDALPRAATAAPAPPVPSRPVLIRIVRRPRLAHPVALAASRPLPGQSLQSP